MRKCEQRTCFEKIEKKSIKTNLYTGAAEKQLIITIKSLIILIIHYLNLQEVVFNAGFFLHFEKMVSIGKQAGITQSVIDIF